MKALDPTTKKARKFLQRWVGAPQTGDLNDPAFLEELFKDLPGLQKYLLEKEGEENPAPRVPEEVEAPGRYKDFTHTTPNMGGTIRPIGPVFHHSAGSFQGTLSWIKQSKSKVSYHVLIHPDGSRHNVVPLHRRAWHAGKSFWKGRSGCNGFTIGVAFSGNTYDRPLTPQEINSAVEFVRINKDKFGWTEESITHHMEVSPGRKNDLNPKEFRRLKKAILRRVFNAG